jgi:hypothetical protein
MFSAAGRYHRNLKDSHRQPVVVRQWPEKEIALPASPQTSEDNKRPASELAEQACKEVVENLKKNVVEPRTL